MGRGTEGDGDGDGEWSTNGLVEGLMKHTDHSYDKHRDCA